MIMLQDRTMRCWDLRTPSCQGLLEAPSGIPTAAFDHQVCSHFNCCLSFWGNNVERMIDRSPALNAVLAGAKQTSATAKKPKLRHHKKP